MKLKQLAAATVLVIGLAVVGVDHFVVNRMESTYKELEKERLDITNRLATAKIVQENLNHVTDLLTKNMESAGTGTAAEHETEFYRFITESVNDLRMTLIATRPTVPVTEGEVTKFGYEMELEGDFFKFGELCAKFENSRRIISIEEFDVIQSQEHTNGITQTVRITMKLQSYLIRRSASSEGGV